MRTSTKTDKFLSEIKNRGHFIDTLDYSKVNYVNANIKVIIIDPSTGNEHFIRPKTIISRGIKLTERNRIKK